MPLALTDLAPRYHSGQPAGMPSVCSAHPLVLRAALQHGRDTGDTVLIEATCNQVNHLGGYTGMTPTDFAQMVHDLAAAEGCPGDLIILGGDHLGPNPWRHLPAEDAMAQAEQMVAAYVAAGFGKIHLDASMGCAGEPEALDDTTTAHRAARLARVAEETAKAQSLPPPHYIIGTEVPPPGGADHELTTVSPTDPKAARDTLAVHQQVFVDQGLASAFARVLGLVVQPGVEFGNKNTVFYRPEAATGLTQVLGAYPQLIFEAHSTDYQGTTPLAKLVRDGFPILKVGPELTFVLREALYALDLVASDLLPDYGARPLFSAMEALMTRAPENWERHYHGSEAEQRVLRHYSLSDRIRYYWTTLEAQTAVQTLLDALRGQSVPLPLMWQHMPAAASFASAPLDPETLLIWRVRQSLHSYYAACAGAANF